MLKKKLLRSFFDEESDSGEVRTKFVQNRIKMVEKHFPELGKALSDYVDKNAKARNGIDQIAEVLDNYAKAENVTTAFKFQINDFANVLLDVATKQDCLVHAVETRVLEQLCGAGKLCGGVHADLKLSIMAHDKERSWKRQLQKVKENQFQNPEQVSLAEAEFLKAKGESARFSKGLEEQIDIFERKRLNVVKESLLAWSLAELHFHAKALELFTEAYRLAADMDVNADLEEFRNKLRNTLPSDSPRRSESLLQLLSLPFHRNRFNDSGIPHPPSVQSSSRSSLLQSTETV